MKRALIKHMEYSEISTNVVTSLYEKGPDKAHGILSDIQCSLSDLCMKKELISIFPNINVVSYISVCKDMRYSAILVCVAYMPYEKGPHKSWNMFLIVNVVFHNYISEKGFVPQRY